MAITSSVSQRGFSTAQMPPRSPRVVRGGWQESPVSARYPLGRWETLLTGFPEKAGKANHRKVASMIPSQRLDVCGVMPISRPS